MKVTETDVKKYLSCKRNWDKFLDDAVIPLMEIKIRSEGMPLGGGLEPEDITVDWTGQNFEANWSGYRCGYEEYYSAEMPISAIYDDVGYTEELLREEKKRKEKEKEARRLRQIALNEMEKKRRRAEYEKLKEEFEPE